MRRLPARADYDPAVAYRLFDEAVMCHVGYVLDGVPYVIPMLHVRADDRLYLHGAAGNRTLDAVVSGAAVCVETTLLDGLVLGRSAYENSVNYRSVIAFGQGRPVEGEDAKRDAMTLLLRRLLPPGRLEDVRALSPRELARTKVIELTLAECSVKVRRGPALDDRRDLDAPVWAGEIPFLSVLGTPRHDGAGRTDIPAPAFPDGWAGPPNPR
ncbi:pyridoxamine 5'-phosphate oxidase family protein [Rhizohabitans arisaemae]|uniref:pyridoxamine 5'-phosphate oxidase family protein n=1 Tax=Rhizohabitans arisaemae TaxID=2720610 RepID=UPI0024B17271|nr:pyridoxamine 5'-phosphate oxidase family protein [Rhizohabitans arisaemae]